MKELPIILLLCLTLSGCFDPNRLYLAEALGAFDAQPQETDNLQLAGVSLGDANCDGIGLTREQGETLFRRHRGHTGEVDGQRQSGRD